ncbi:PAS domain S-box protein, partial [candidate division KSB1 bacterium]|nr:PAS domain S-box protein [candidate division KSB1 bacterium]NIS24471.1 PAS domain S-box protein [candidate division KSB1 bacterium]NIT70890.1 PAS domain S-box protein [candidate division KSB1 bacterium]NIU26377.1 PAS domain S-box protein [candidate division KSB1 bacterium]NIU90193.1 PAS domain S-box protein [candidate division KSB1 bacterium]
MADKHRVQENFWETILNSVMEGIVAIDKHGIVRHINIYAASTLGISPTQARGRHFQEVFCPSLPRDRCWVDSALSSGQRIESHNFEMEQTDGSKRRLIGKLTPINSGNTSIG